MLSNKKHFGCFLVLAKYKKLTVALKKVRPFFYGAEGRAAAPQLKERQRADAQRGVLKNRFAILWSRNQPFNQIWIFCSFAVKILRVIKMNSDKDKIVKNDDPYRFDLTADFLRDRYNKICGNKSRIKTEQKIREENNKN